MCDDITASDVFPAASWRLFSSTLSKPGYLLASSESFTSPHRSALDGVSGPKREIEKSPKAVIAVNGTRKTTGKRREGPSHVCGPSSGQTACEIVFSSSICRLRSPPRAKHSPSVYFVFFFPNITTTDRNKSYAKPGGHRLGYRVPETRGRVSPRIALNNLRVRDLLNSIVRTITAECGVRAGNR